MKLGIFLLIFGLLIAGGGAYAWQYYNPSFLGYRPAEAQQFFSLGIAGMILGGGLAIGGIVRMIVKR
ncbi:MAG: hypothetical protein DRI01_06755 [Chloroflexi bacterium]|nr:MAG: hypothetical protein DRI01_06755 [Chloroflexota bacterium]